MGCLGTGRAICLIGVVWRMPASGLMGMATHQGQTITLRIRASAGLLRDGTESRYSSAVVIISIANQKGGVGKTTTAVNLVAALAFKGHRSLLVDMDPQSNSTMSFVDPQTVERSMYDVLVDKQCTMEQVIRPTTVLGLDIAPSRISMAKLETKLLGEVDGHYRLKDRLDEVRQRYSFVVIDTPPTLGLITVNALVAATHLLIPIQSSYFALEGTDDLLETVDKVKSRPNPGLKILGVLVTLHDRRTAIARDSLAAIRNLFGDKVFKTVITKSVRLEESPAYKETIFTYAPDSSGAVEYDQLTEEILSCA
ncbi:MAG: ParA family protein [Acidobacteriota bacterium]